MKTKIFITLAIATVLYACTKTNPNLVIITGEITNPAGENVAFSSKDTSYTTTITEDGTFEISFSLDSSTYFDFEYGIEVTAMYIMPGDKIHLTIDPNQFDETIKYKGSPASSFLAKKYLLREETDFLGKEYYLGSSEEYKTFLNAYRTSVINEIGAIKDSSFIKKQMAGIDKDFTYYIERQAWLLEYGDDVRMYIMERREVDKVFGFFKAIDSLNGDEFNDLVNEYGDTLNLLLNNVTDEDYKIKAKKGIERTKSRWIERKSITDNKPKDGEPAIDFIYPDKDGKEFSLSSFKGSLVYVDVWATWCGPCVGEIPASQELEKEYHDKNIVFISISVDSDKDAWLKMVEEKELKGIQLWAGESAGISKDYAIFGIPRFILFSADGNIISTDAPRPSSPEIRGLLDSNL